MQRAEDVVKTNRDQLVALRTQIRLLNDKIVAAGREQKYLKMAKEVAEGKVTFVPLEEEQWDVMLPAEQDTDLLRYYHTLRIELQSMSAEVKKVNTIDKVTSWLDSRWVKRPMAASGLIALAWEVFQQVHNLGLFAMEDHHEDSPFRSSTDRGTNSL
jgi:hypothetical protein